MFALNSRTPYKIERNEPSPAILVAEHWPAATVDHGAQIYENTCAVCHGATARSSGVLPDLRRSGALADKATWKGVVIDGILKDNGMVSFAKYLSEDDAEAVRAYVAGRAKVLSEKGI